MTEERLKKIEEHLNNIQVIERIYGDVTHMAANAYVNDVPELCQALRERNAILHAIATVDVEDEGFGSWKAIARHCIALARQQLGLSCDLDDIRRNTDD